jgi:hypothetical protein
MYIQKHSVLAAPNRHPLYPHVFSMDLLSGFGAMLDA